MCYAESECLVLYLLRSKSLGCTDKGLCFPRVALFGHHVFLDWHFSAIFTLAQCSTYGHSCGRCSALSRLFIPDNFFCHELYHYTKCGTVYPTSLSGATHLNLVIILASPPISFFSLYQTGFHSAFIFLQSWHYSAIFRFSMHWLCSAIFIRFLFVILYHRK